MRSKQCQGCQYLMKDCKKDTINNWYSNMKIIRQWVNYRTWCRKGPMPIALITRCPRANSGKGGVHIA